MYDVGVETHAGHQEKDSAGGPRCVKMHQAMVLKRIGDVLAQPLRVPRDAQVLAHEIGRAHGHDQERAGRPGQLRGRQAGGIDGPLCDATERAITADYDRGADRWVGADGGRFRLGEQHADAIAAVEQGRLDL